MNSVGAEPALKKRSAEGKGRKGKFEKRSLNLAEAYNSGSSILRITGYGTERKIPKFGTAMAEADVRLL